MVATTPRWLRLTRAGYRMYYQPAARMLHRDTPRTLSAPFETLQRDRNRRRLVRQHYSLAWRLVFALWFYPTRVVRFAQDGTFVLALGAITGAPAIGLAVALVRRGRELVWILLGLLLFWSFSGRATHPNAPEGA